METLVYCFILLFSTLLTSVVALQCYSTPCSLKEIVCFKQCPHSHESCYSVVNTESGEIIEASCSKSCRTRSRVCELQETNVPKIKTCCCVGDYCNRRYGGALKLNAEFRPLPLLPLPSNLPDTLICEHYLCHQNSPYCYHHFQYCPKSHISSIVCQSQYNYTNGYLIPVFKGCSYATTDTTVRDRNCHVDNPSIVSKGTFSCYCTGNYCNQNETFTHVTELASYGQKKYEEMGYQHYCPLVNNQRQCQTIKSENVCRDDKADCSSYVKYALYGGGFVLGGITMVVAVPLVLPLFSTGGIVAGSIGAWMMSASAPVAGGGIVAMLQSFGAAGIGLSGYFGLYAAGSTIGTGAAGLGDYIFCRQSNKGQNDDHSTE